MTRSIYIAKSGAKMAPTLPEDAVTRTFGIFGVKDSGKTTTARVLVEGICKVGGHVVVLDPVGVWWGATRAGDGPGIPGIVLGGEHGDVPLEETGGQLVAELAVSRAYPLVVIDLKLLRKGAAQRFMADFTEGVYFANRRPLHVVFEEADRALPQNPRGMDPTLGRLLGAAEDIVKLGRSRGLGSTFISQRIASVTKNVTEQVEALILHRQIGPRDRKAVKDWIESNGEASVTQKVLDSMASLDQGEAWLYSPGWLRVLERVRMRMPKTLDSSATPRNDDERDERDAAPRAKVDLDVLRERMAETVERARQNDPKELRKQIAALQRELAAAQEEQVSREVEVEVLVPDREAVAALSALLAEFEAVVDALDEAQRGLTEHAEQILTNAGEARTLAHERMADLRVALDKVGGLPARTRVEETPAAPSPPRQQPASPRPAPTPVADGELSAGAQRLLEEMRGLVPLRLSRTQLATILGRGKKSSTLTQQLGELVAGGYVSNAGGYAVVESNGGPPLTGDALTQRWLSALPDGPAALLRELIEAGELAKDDLFTRAGFSPTSSTPVTHLKLLSDNGLAERRAGMIVLGGAAA